jgi:hypothetical protein
MIVWGKKRADNDEKFRQPPVSMPEPKSETGKETGTPVSMPKWHASSHVGIISACWNHFGFVGIMY